MLQDTRSIFMVLGSYISKPDLFVETDIEITVDDFPQRFHKIIFSAIKNLWTADIKTIDVVAIDCYLAQYKDTYKIFEENKGIEWIQEAQELANVETFKYNVLRIKKYTLLRNLLEHGFDIRRVYDESDDSKMEEFDKMDLSDIIGVFNKSLLEIERDINQIENGSHISEGVDELIEDLEQNPTMGYDSGINPINYYMFGLRRKYYLFSAKTGEGKTRIQAFFALQLGYYQKIPVLLISTEVPKDEVQTMMIAHLAKVDERKLLVNNLTKQEKERVQWAKEEIKKANIYILYIPDFTLENIEHIIKRYIAVKKVEYIFFDYIKESISMMEGLNKKVGQIDGWKSLNLFSERLKTLSEKYKVGIMSATQLSQIGTTSGSSAIPNAVDVWCKLRVVENEEREQYNLNQHLSCEDDEIMAIDAKKNRRGMKDFTIYFLANLGQLKFQEVLVVKNGNPIKVPKMKLNY